MLTVSLFPEAGYVFGVNVGMSVIIAWCVIALVLIGLVVLNLLVVRKMKAVPTGAQNVVEFVVDGLHHWGESQVGHAADFVVPVSMTLMLYVFSTTIIELFGLPPATDDINCTFALGLCTFITVNV
ncbi:MAG: hypothetical protein EOM58_11875, partial [Clostridia bacterium]|nr:hypothetical protein [Clostridia bacterium]